MNHIYHQKNVLVLLHMIQFRRFVILCLMSIVVFPNVAQAVVYSDIVFPVEGAVSFSDDFGHPRSGGRLHEGTDIIADKHTPVVAAVSGVIGFAPMEEPSYGWIVNLEGDDGYRYVYIHLNNDSIGTDDGAGGRDLAIAPGIERGARVEAGDLIGWLGDSGNAESTVSHLHFELREDGEALNVYDTLVAAYGSSSYDPDIERNAAANISTDLILEEAEDVACVAHSLVRTQELDAVYYCGIDGKRYAFQNSRVYFSWYDDFDTVEMISIEEMGDIPFGGVVTYRPGERLVKIQSVPHVYAVARNGTLRWIQSEEVAESIYGSSWADYVDDVPDAFFNAYQIGDAITSG